MVHWINFLRLWCWLIMGIITGMFIEKNRVSERLKASLIKEKEKKNGHDDGGKGKLLESV